MFTLRYYLIAPILASKAIPTPQKLLLAAAATTPALLVPCLTLSLKFTVVLIFINFILVHT